MNAGYPIVQDPSGRLWLVGGGVPYGVRYRIDGYPVSVTPEVATWPVVDHASCLFAWQESNGIPGASCRTGHLVA